MMWQNNNGENYFAIKHDKSGGADKVSTEEVNKMFAQDHNQINVYHCMNRRWMGSMTCTIF
jgi:hypothetical protein